MNGRLLMAKIHVQTWGYIFEIVGWFCNTSRLRYRVLFSFIARRFEVMLF